jgi:hypothetical protein
MLALYQRVALRWDFPDHRLQKGDIVTLVDFAPHAAGGERGCVVEVFNAVGDSLKVIVVPESAVEPLTSDELLTVRPMTEAIT